MISIVRLVILLALAGCAGAQVALPTPATVLNNAPALKADLNAALDTLAQFPATHPYALCAASIKALIATPAQSSAAFKPEIKGLLSAGAAAVLLRYELEQLKLQEPSPDCYAAIGRLNVQAVRDAATAQSIVANPLGALKALVP